MHLQLHLAYISIIVCIFSQFLHCISSSSLNAFKYGSFYSHFLKCSSFHLVQVHISFAFTLAHPLKRFVYCCVWESTPKKALMGPFVELQRWLEGWFCWLFRVAKPKQALVNVYSFHFDEFLMHFQGFKLMFVC